MNKIKLFAVTALLMFSGMVQAAPIFVGTFQTDDGPWWTTNPPVYSAVEAAAMIFGGDASDYRISISDSMDPLSITDTGWYTIIGIAGGHEYADDYKLDLGGVGYGAPGWQNGDDISAYTGDNAYGDQYTMYVWRDSVMVPAPKTLAIMSLLMIGLAVRRYIR
ncbi:PEP-CTERM sorting domain-containing protein [Corallincola platygyrae]|uniref:PEP-CTERM sorting domain-containing protein n=1 Tax=Corallincola platygyrae TaxID=1193278 RepID=A0ABW4XSE7_9GAMM